VIDLIKDQPLMNKKGVHPALTRVFNRFLNEDRKANKTFAECGGKFFAYHNIAGGSLYFPVDTADDAVMTKYANRVYKLIPVDYTGVKRGKVKGHEPMKGQIIRGNNKEHKFMSPKRLTIHLKKSPGRNNHFHSTLSFTVNSKEDVIGLVWYRYRGRVQSYYLNGKRYDIA